MAASAAIRNERKRIMQWHTNAQQDLHPQNHQDSYQGYLGWSQEPPHTSEYQQEEPRHTFQQQEYQSPRGFEPISYIQQEQVQPALALNYTSLAAILCYSIGWLTGLLFLLFTRENRFVRFHALQSLAFFGSINLLDIALVKIAMYHLPYLSHLAIPVFLLLNFIAFIGWCVAIVQASRGKYYRLPFIGNLVAASINRGPK
jgi:uncharacterized membrane protein